MIFVAVLGDINHIGKRTCFNQILIMLLLALCSKPPNAVKTPIFPPLFVSHLDSYSALIQQQQSKEVFPL